MGIEIFVSHSSKDKVIVDSFVDNILQLGLGFDRSEVFCTSSEGMGIKSGEDWRRKIEESFKQSRVVILIITPNYKASEICQNEMGAAWISEKLVVPLIVEPIDYKSVGVIAEPKQITKLNSTDGIDEIHTCLNAVFPNIKDNFDVTVWSSKKRIFLRDLINQLNTNLFPTVLSQSEIQDKIKELEGLQQSFDDLLVEMERLKKQIGELEIAKDKDEVNEIRKKYVTSSVVDEFDDLVKNAKEKLKLVDAVVRTIIFNTLYGESLDVRGVDAAEKSKACSKKYIDTDDNALWEKRVMKDIKDALITLNDFIDGLDSDGCEEILEKYPDIGIDCSDLDFWEKHIAIRLSYIS